MARSSSTKWSSTKTCIGSVTSEALRAFSSGWPSTSADARRSRINLSRGQQARFSGAITFQLVRRHSRTPAHAELRTARILSVLREAIDRLDEFADAETIYAES